MHSRIMALPTLLLVVSLLFGPSSGHPRLKDTRAATASSDLTVDLGYAVYQGFPDQNTGINAWLGMRYAAPPTADNRWREPQSPGLQNNGQPIQANNPYYPQCPQSFQSPVDPNWISSGGYQGDEDCLFLSVFASEGAESLPVIFYIHGGGYGAGNGRANITEFYDISGREFVAVVIQYRLEAFGFLADSEIKENGALNAGLLDQHFALEWVQQNIAKFGGDPTRVTLAGQSAGAGSVMLQAMAYGGSEGTKYFEGGIAASPYTPVTYHYTDDVLRDRYQRYAAQVGCDTANSILNCLRQTDTSALQRANAVIGGGVNFGSWAFVPVVDDDFIRQRPSQQLTSGAVNGARILTSHNSDEAPQFINPNVTSPPAFEEWLLIEYPHLTADDISQISSVHYPTNTTTLPYNFATCGNCDSSVNAVTVGSWATADLQRALNFYSEVTFACPSYWLAGAFTRASGKSGYKYQFSIPPGQHGLDLTAEGLAPLGNFAAPQIQADFQNALTTAWGNFIATGDPSVSNSIANGQMASNPTASNPASQWPQFDITTPPASGGFQMLNWNQTGGSPYQLALFAGFPAATELVGSGIANSISQVDADSWEGGRGARCEFLKSIGGRLAL